MSVYLLFFSQDFRIFGILSVEIKCLRRGTGPLSLNATLREREREKNAKTNRNKMYGSLYSSDYLHQFGTILTAFSDFTYLS